MCHRHCRRARLRLGGLRVAAVDVVSRSRIAAVDGHVRAHVGARAVFSTSVVDVTRRGGRRIPTDLASARTPMKTFEDNYKKLPTQESVTPI